MPLYLKNAYADDPAFIKSKIVYALRDEAFEGPLNERFVDKLKADQFDDQALKSTDGIPVDFVALNKLAIDHCDAIVQSTPDVDPVLMEYARQSGKPILEYDPDEAAFLEQYAEFYNSLID